MEIVSSILSWIFSYLFYPGIIIAIFLIDISYLTYTVSKSKDKPRVIAGAMLPFFALIFAVVSSQSGGDTLGPWLNTFSPTIRFIFGITLAIFLLESGRFLLKRQNGLAWGLFAFFLSCVDVFVLYSLMTGLIKELHGPLFGFVVGCSLDILFFGLPAEL